MEYCKKRRLRKAIKFHLREAKIFESIYHHDGMYEGPYNENFHFKNKVQAEKRCANRIRHLLVKLQHKIK